MKRNNEKAFPTGNPEQGGQAGMDLRDWFAGQALVGLIEHHLSESRIHHIYEDVLGAKVLSTVSYKIADAMMKAREV